MATNHALSETEIQENLISLKGWKSDTSCIKKKFKFESYLDGINFVVECAKVSEKLQHHPEMIVTYKVVEVIYTTHHLGNKVSPKDIMCAKELNKIS